jgi:hypothetical protein
MGRAKIPFVILSVAARRALCETQFMLTDETETALFFLRVLTAHATWITNAERAVALLCRRSGANCSAPCGVSK